MLNFDDLAAGDVIHWPDAPTRSAYYVVLHLEAGSVQLAVLGDDRKTGDLIATDHLVMAFREELSTAYYVGLMLELRP